MTEIVKRNLCDEYDGYAVIGGIAPSTAWLDGTDETFVWALFEHDDATVIAELRDVGGNAFDLDNDPLRPAYLQVTREGEVIHSSNHPDYFIAIVEAHRQAARAFGIPGHQPSVGGGPRI